MYSSRSQRTGRSPCMRFSPFRIARRYGEIEPLAEWLIGLAALLEELAPDVPAEPPAPLDLLPPTR